jgi:hypothetical protein
VEEERQGVNPMISRGGVCRGVRCEISKTYKSSLCPFLGPVPFSRPRFSSILGPNCDIKQSI